MRVTPIGQAGCPGAGLPGSIGGVWPMCRNTLPADDAPNAVTLA